MGTFSLKRGSKPYTKTSICTPDITFSALLCASGSAAAHAAGSTHTRLSGNAALAITALDITQISVTRPHSSTSSGESLFSRSASSSEPNAGFSMMISSGRTACAATSTKPHSTSP